MSSAYQATLPEADYEYAVSALGETKERREQCLTEINNWLDENPQINANRHPVNLLHFLRGSKFQMDKAKRRLEQFYRMRAERTEWFSNRDPFLPVISELLELGVFIPLSKKDVNGCQVFIIRSGVHNAKKHSQNDVLKVCKMILDLVLHLDETVSIYGAVAIIDMAGVTWHHAIQMTPTIIKRSVYSWENYTCKNKRMEFINAPRQINLILDTFRLFMSSKMKQRLFVTRGLSTVDVELPSDLGGNGPSYKEMAYHWKKKVEENASWYAEQETYKMCLQLKG